MSCSSNYLELFLYYCSFFCSIQLVKPKPIYNGNLVIKIFLRSSRYSKRLSLSGESAK